MLLSAAFVFCGQLVFADLTNTQRAAYYLDNQNSQSLKINDDNGANREKVYTLFNKYFDLKAGNKDYVTSSNQLYDKRGVRGDDGKLGDVTWISTGDSTFYASALSAGNKNTLSIIDPKSKNVLKDSTNKELSWPFGSGENQILGDGHSGQKLNVGNNTQFEWSLTSTPGSGSGTTWYSDTYKNADGMIHMIVLDVSDLMLKMISEKNGWDAIIGGTYEIYDAGDDTWHDSDVGNYLWVWEDEAKTKGVWNDYYAYMLCWEDTAGTSSGCDFDYQDMVAIISFIQPAYVTPYTPSSATPEPATMLLIGLGMAGAGLAARRRKNS